MDAVSGGERLWKNRYFCSAMLLAACIVRAPIHVQVKVH